MGRACRTNGKLRKSYRILVGKPRPSRGWVGNIKMDLREIRWSRMDWIHLAEDRDYLRAVVNTLMNLPVP
jgi:hypothetical protein